jgi:hypothetical protein
MWILSWQVISTALIGAAGILLFLASSHLIRYAKAVRKAIKQLRDEDRLLNSGMVRLDPKDRPSVGEQPMRILELNPKFVEANKHCQMTSLGAYLSSIRPAMFPKDMKLSDWMEKELQSVMGLLLLSYLGPNFGKSMLPSLGFGAIESRLHAVASTGAMWWAGHFSDDAKEMKKTKENPVSSDSGVLGITLSGMIETANTHGQAQGMNMEKSPLDCMEIGEVAQNPHFGANHLDSDEPLLPNPFIVSEHFEKALHGMEKLIEQRDGECDPDSRTLPDPEPVNEKLLPGLHFGWGNALDTHTKREVVRNRLMCCLLNRLGFNYYRDEQDIGNHFVIKMTEKGKALIRPEAFVQCLLDSGHSFVACSKQHITSFGIGLSIKEKDGSWSSIPLALFYQTGYADENGREVHASCPHGGMELNISGPLIGTDKNGNPSNCSLANFMAIDGLCGWHSNHYTDVPWLEYVQAGKEYRDRAVLDVVRMEGLLSVVLNATGTELELPFGGYGLTGVCNDSAALLDQVLEGTTNLQPLVTTGRFMIHLMRRFRKLRNRLEGKGKLSKEFNDIKKIIKAAQEIESDLNTTPGNLRSAARRIKHCMPIGSPFLLHVEADEMLTKLVEEMDSIG